MGCDAVTVSVTYSDAGAAYLDAGIAIAFGAGVLPGVDPLFAAPDEGDFHLCSTHGRWTPAGPVTDDADSPALGAGDPAGAASDTPERAGDRSELGAYGNSAEASWVR